MASLFRNSDMWLAHKGTVGMPINCVVHIVGDDGDEVPQASPARSTSRGGNSFEYHNDPEKTAGSRHPQGWSTLGDVGYLDADNYLYLTDRKAYMIISGGVNIYPQEAENVLTMHPSVIDVAVFGVPNDDFGEEVKAVVQPAEMPADDDAATKLAGELIQYCRQHLADVKCPRSIDFREELPRHPTGKLYKRILKDDTGRRPVGQSDRAVARRSASIEHAVHRLPLQTPALQFVAHPRRCCSRSQQIRRRSTL